MRHMFASNQKMRLTWHALPVEGKVAEPLEDQSGSNIIGKTIISVPQWWIVAAVYTPSCIISVCSHSCLILAWFRPTNPCHLGWSRVLLSHKVVRKRCQENKIWTNWHPDAKITWKWMVGRLLPFWEGQFFRGFLSFRKGISSKWIRVVENHNTKTILYS